MHIIAKLSFCLDGGIGRHVGLKIPFREKCEFDSRSRHQKPHNLCPGGGIGRHVRLRCVCRKVCGFESHLGHQNISNEYIWIKKVNFKVHFFYSSKFTVGAFWAPSSLWNKFFFSNHNTEAKILFGKLLI